MVSEIKKKHDQFISNFKIITLVITVISLFGFIYFTFMTEPIIIEETYNIDYDIDSQTTDFTLNLTFRKTQFLVVKIAFYDQTD
ncbi:hypothetical protein [Acholeplasma laidlawii]|uniref:hypothetical protein n=1 Tax=Acholeplasma laidlawii TaxID=2148 RepID=UPI0021F6E287|nr:hypothetical protein [Acholeplasma laidlawii]